MVHYVYQIIHKWSGRRYVGVRSCDGRPEEDIGIKYFSSSRDKAFIEEQRMFKHKFNYEVLEEFDTREAAIKREIEIHNFCDIANNPDFYNKAKQTSTGFTRRGCKDNVLTKRRKCMATRGKNNGNSRPVYQIDIKTYLVIKKWSWAGEAAATLNLDAESIRACANPKRVSTKTYRGFGWVYNKNKITKITKNNVGQNHYASKSVYQIDIKTRKIIKKWSWAGEAAVTLNLDRRRITDAAKPNTSLKNYGNFLWTYDITVIPNYKNQRKNK